MNPILTERPSSTNEFSARGSDRQLAGGGNANRPTPPVWIRLPDLAAPQTVIEPSGQGIELVEDVLVVEEPGVEEEPVSIVGQDWRLGPDSTGVDGQEVATSSDSATGFVSQTGAIAPSGGIASWLSRVAPAMILLALIGASTLLLWFLLSGGTPAPTGEDPGATEWDATLDFEPARRAESVEDMPQGVAVAPASVAGGTDIANSASGLLPNEQPPGAAGEIDPAVQSAWPAAAPKRPSQPDAPHEERLAERREPLAANGATGGSANDRVVEAAERDTRSGLAGLPPQVALPEGALRGKSGLRKAGLGQAGLGQAGRVDVAALSPKSAERQNSATVVGGQVPAFAEPIGILEPLEFAERRQPIQRRAQHDDKRSRVY